MKFITQLITGMTIFCTFAVGMWALGDLIGVDTSIDLIIYSYFSGVVMVYLTFKLCILQGTQYRMIYAPRSLHVRVNTFLASIIFCTIMGAAMLLSGKVIIIEGLVEYLSCLFLPPLFMCFLPTLLMRWKAEDGEKMTKDFALLAKPFGFELASK